MELPSYKKQLDKNLEKMGILEFTKNLTFTDYSSKDAPAKAEFEAARNLAFSIIGSDDKTRKKIGTPATVDDVKIIGFTPKLDGGYEMKTSYKVGQKVYTYPIQLSSDNIDQLNLPIVQMHDYLEQSLAAQESFYQQKGLTNKIPTIEIPYGGKTYVIKKSGTNYSVGEVTSNGVNWNKFSGGRSIVSVKNGIELIRSLYGGYYNPSQDQSIDDILSKYLQQ